MNIENKDTTLIIHGPLSMYTVFSLYHHADVFPIIIVAPCPKEMKDNSILQEIHRFIDKRKSGISLFLYDDTIDTKSIQNEQNRYYHFHSVLLGLQSCSTKYAIKIRSDEFYSNLSPIVDAIKDNDGKLITTDVFFRNCNMPYHPSDHVVAGTTIVMTDTFDLAKKMCIGFEPPQLTILRKYINDRTNKPFVAAEQYIGMGAILTQSSPSKLKEPDCSSLMKELFIIVATEELGMFRVMFNSASPKPIEYTDSKYFTEGTDIKDINDYICK